MASSRKNSNRDPNQRSRTSETQHTDALPSSPRPRARNPTDVSYRTGPNYSPDEIDDEGDAPGDGEALSDDELDGQGDDEASFEGDGLDALDPEVGERTMVLPAEDVELSVSNAAPPEGADPANATRAGPPMKLEIIAGPDAGKVKRFKGVKMIIGRTVGVDLLLSDQSVSRRHVELVQSEGGVLLKDLGSGNGTKVNGTKVAEKKLEHGDQISIGKTMLRFVDEIAAFNKAREERERQEAEEKAAREKAEAAAAAALAAAEAAAAGEAHDDDDDDDDDGDDGDEVDSSAPNNRRGRIILGVMVVVMVGLGIAVIALWPSAPPVESKKVLASQKIDDARKAFHKGDIVSTLALVAEAEQLFPGIDRDKLGATAQAEQVAGALLSEVTQAIEARRFEDARHTLAAMGTGSGKTEEAKVKLSAALNAAELAYKQGKIDEFLAAGEIDAANALVFQLPAAQQQEFAAKSAARAQELEAQALAAEKRQQSIKGGAAARKKELREKAMQDAFAAVERKFAGSEWDRAASECSRVMLNAGDDQEIWSRAKKLQALIPEFGKHYDEGLQLHRQGKLGLAAKPLRQAHQLYRQMNLLANRFADDLDDKLGAAAVVAGQEALKREEIVVAWQMFNEAARLRQTDSRVQTGLDQVSKQADALFEKAYALRDSDSKEAKRLLALVMQITAAGSTQQQKAKELLAAMSFEAPH